MKKGSILLFVVLILCLAVSLSWAKESQVETLIGSISLGASQDEVTKLVPGLKKASSTLKDGWDCYELADPDGELVALKCAFSSGKLVFLMIETKDGSFDKVKKKLEKKYGAFPQPSDHAVFELKKEDNIIRLIRTGEENTAAQIMIGNL